MSMAMGLTPVPNISLSGDPGDPWWMAATAA